MAAKLKVPADVKALAKQHGAEVDVISGRRADVTVWSPVGSVWNATDAHCLCGTTDAADASECSEMWADFAERMRDGVSPCTDSDCDTCHPVGEPAPSRLRLVVSR